MRIHVIAGTENGTFKCIIHGATPAGNNSAGFSWAGCLVAAGLANTRLPIGDPATQPGTVAQAEHDQIAAGTLMEAAFDFVPDPALDDAATAAALDAAGNQALADLQNRLGKVLKWYGLTRA